MDYTHAFANKPPTSSMSIAIREIFKTPAPKTNAHSSRAYAASLKAIIDSRHTNTKRNTKRRSSEPWIGEMIVVKEYDQMDSLRDILNQPARICISSENDEQAGMNDSEERVAKETSVGGCADRSLESVRHSSCKRGRDEENMEVELQREPQNKRNRALIKVTDLYDRDQSPPPHGSQALSDHGIVPP